MTSSAPRIVIAAVMLVVIWIVTYWAWPVDEPDAPPRITFDPPRETIQPPTLDPTRPAAVPAAEPEPIVEAAAADLFNPEVTGVQPPVFTEYTVQRGDTIMGIAQTVYGGTRYWQAIGKANPLVDVQKLRVGQTLRIPVDPQNIQGIAIDSEDEDTAPADALTDVIEYVVKPGDTLTGIARSLYGRASLWTLIRDANRGVVNRDGTNLRPGMRLTIPPAPNTARE